MFSVYWNRQSLPEELRIAKRNKHCPPPKDKQPFTLEYTLHAEHFCFRNNTTLGGIYEVLRNLCLLPLMLVADHNGLGFC